MKRKTLKDAKLPDFGKIAKREMKKLHMTQTALAKKCGWGKSAITDLFKKRNWTVGELLVIGRHINHDLVQYLYPTPPEGTVPAGLVTQLQLELSEERTGRQEDRETIIKLKTEVALLKELLEKK